MNPTSAHRPPLVARLLLLLLLGFSILSLGTGTIRTAAAASSRELFITSGIEHPDNTVTLPLHRGTSHGGTVLFIILDASDEAKADALGVNRPQKLANARDTAAVQRVTLSADGRINFPHTVDFRPSRMVVPGPRGFPPKVAMPGAVGEPGYSPLIQLPDGTILNAPQIANGTGRADKIVWMDTVHLRVRYRETMGEQGGEPVHYLSTDASDSVAAALENVTFAPALNNAPTLDDDSTHSARATLVAFTNGQTGAGNPVRQGLNSALLDGRDPLNVLRWNPAQGRYSPLWDVHLTQWTAAAITDGANTRQTDVGTILGLVDHGVVVGFNGTAGGGTFGPAGFIVDCPIVSRG